MDDILEQAAAELEKSIADDQKSETPTEPQDVRKGLVDAITKAAKDYLAKGQSSDLKAEKDRRGSLTESGKDPAESPKKTGKEYSDSSGYEARKADDMDEDEDDEDDKPAFFKKKNKKKKKAYVSKSYDESEADESEDDESEEEVYDATELAEHLVKSNDRIEKSIAVLEDGLATFGEIIAELSDPRRDQLLVNLSKGLTFLINENKEIKKSLESHNQLMKAISTMPGVPRAAALQLLPGKETDLNKAEGEEKTDKLSKGDKDRLFQAAVAKKITTEEYTHAVKSGDVSVLEKAK